MGLKPQGPEKEEKKKEEKKKDLKKKKQAPYQKVKYKPSEELKKKKRYDRNLSLISEERRVSKRRLLRLAEETSSSAEDEMSAIITKPMNTAHLQNLHKDLLKLEKRGLWSRNMLLKKNSRNKLKQKL